MCRRQPVQQSAYRSFHSTERALFSVHNDLIRSIDNGKLSLLVILDLSAAFNTVDHQLLPSVLANGFSIDSMALRWFQSYLTDRTQTFTYNGRETSSFSVGCSVPQGSVLGARCFVSHTVVDQLERHAVQSHMYADDSQFHDSCRPDDIDTLRSRLSRSRCADDSNSWCKSRRLQLNANKTEAIWIGSRSNLANIAHSDRSVQVDSSKIQPSAVVRDLILCLHLDSKLSLEAPCGQSPRHLPLPSPTPPLDSTTCWPGGHDSAVARNGDH